MSGTVTSELAARSFLQGYGTLFGLKDQTSEASVMRQAAVAGGRNKVRFQQRYKGIPVLAGELNINIDRNNNILSANGEIAPDLALNVTPSVTAAAAQTTARAAVGQTNKLPADQFEAGKPALWIFSPQLVDQPNAPAALVWRMDVAGRTRLDIRETMLVDAHGGKVVFHWSLAEAALNRNTYTASRGGTLPGTLCKTEAGNTSNSCATDADVTNAHNLAGTTYNYYGNTFGRDSINGAGMTLISTAHYCPNTAPCSWANAQWNGTQMMYGDGFAAADDIVAHELTHGVTQYESGLIYNGESGAINESLSDVFGELVDLTDGTGNDATSVRWLIGEDGPGGALRSMSDPPSSSQGKSPDRMSSPYFGIGAFDNGYVHFNSGVNNKAAALMTDGGFVNGTLYTGLGTDKVGRIYYEAQTNLLTSGSNYHDLGSILPQACTNLIGQAGITGSNCNLVRAVVMATEMARTVFLATSGNDASACTAVAAPCRTFGQAVAKVAAGDTIRIIGGTYNDHLTITKAVTIVGSGTIGSP